MSALAFAPEKRPLRPVVTIGRVLHRKCVACGTGKTVGESGALGGLASVPPWVRKSLTR